MQSLYTAQARISPPRLLLRPPSSNLDSNTFPFLGGLGPQGRVQRRERLDGLGDDRIPVDGISLSRNTNSFGATGSQLLPASLGHIPRFGEPRANLGFVVTEVQREVGERVALLGLLYKSVDKIGQVTLVLGTRAELLAGDPNNVGLRVVAGTSKLEECLALGFGEVFGCQVPGGELNNYLGLSRMLLTHVGGITEAENLVFGGQVKGFCELCEGRNTVSQLHQETKSSVDRTA